MNAEPLELIHKPTLTEVRLALLEQLSKQTNESLNRIESHFDKVDKRFDSFDMRMDSTVKWLIGMGLTTFFSAASLIFTIYKNTH
jgi:hypothetical protein